jgi:hypothetical protein
VTSTLAFGGSVLEGTKDLGRTVPSLFRFGFQDDEEPELKAGRVCPFRSCLSTFVANTIQERSNSDFDVKCATIQFYGNNHNSQSDRWIELKVYVESPDMLSYLALKFQVNWYSGRHRNTGQQRLYKFFYLLPFDLWTFYLVRIPFLKGYGSLFWKQLILQRSLMGCNIVSKWQGFIIISESFSYPPYSS